MIRSTVWVRRREGLGEREGRSGRKGVGVEVRVKELLVSCEKNHNYSSKALFFIINLYSFKKKIVLVKKMVHYSML